MTIAAFFTALANIKSIAGYVDTFAKQVAIWYLQKQENKTLSMIADAAAFASRARSDEERYAAAQKWQEALSRPRVSND